MPIALPALWEMLPECRDLATGTTQRLYEREACFFLLFFFLK